MVGRNKFLFVLLGLFFLAGCSGLHIERRHYRKGWQIDLGLRPQKSQTPHQAAAALPIADFMDDSLKWNKSHRTIENVALPNNRVEKKEASRHSNIQNVDDQPQTSKPVLAQKRPKMAHDTFPWYASLAGLIVLPFFPYRRVSRWASQHKGQARTLIGVGSVCLGGGAWMAGCIAAQHEFVLPDAAGMWSASLALAGLVAYPMMPRKSLSYPVQKTLDAVLLGSGLVWAFALGQQTFWAPESFPIDAHWFSALSGKFERAIVDSGFLMGDPDPEGRIAGLYAAEVGLIILSVAVYALLMALIVALSCNLACSGNVAASNVVLIGGFLLLTTGLVFLIRYIHRGLRRKREIQRHGGVPVP